MGIKEDLELVRDRIRLTRVVAMPDQGDGIDRVERQVDPAGVAASEALDRIAVALLSPAPEANLAGEFRACAFKHLPAIAAVEVTQRIAYDLGPCEFRVILEQPDPISPRA